MAVDTCPLSWPVERALVDGSNASSHHQVRHLRGFMVEESLGMEDGVWTLALFEFGQSQRSKLERSECINSADILSLSPIRLGTSASWSLPLRSPVTIFLASST